MLQIIFAAVMLTLVEYQLGKALIQMLRRPDHE